MEPEQLMHLARQITWKHARTAPDKEDIYQEVALALWQAIPKWDSSRSGFETYLWKKGLWALRDYQRNQHIAYKLVGTRRNKTVTTHQVEYDENLDISATEDLPSYNPQLIEALHAETPRNRAVILDYFLVTENMAHVATKHGITEGRVCQITNRFRTRYISGKILPNAKKKSSHVRQTDSLSPRRRRPSTSRRKPSRVIVDTFFLNSVQET